ncbi:MAG TPA: hypothetical protein RMH99_04355 [Sandaracinaceae bacterium LLY-WYZ-13_1]|nr:hypothetical protein [Sandaracinaceae bacterium LLY-WYZ-13_1]
MRVLLVVAVSVLWLAACGGAEPEGEATWETHTTAEESTGGGEDEAEPAD